MSSHLINQILAKPYARVFTPDPSGGYAAQVLEFPGCFSDGDTPDEAYRNLQEAAENWVEAALAQGMAIPEPFATQGYSGTVSLRLPRSIHRRAAQYASRDGVSLNQFFVSAVAARIGAEDQAAAIAARIDDRLDRLEGGVGIRLRVDLAAAVTSPSQSPASNVPAEIVASAPSTGGQGMLTAGTATTIDRSWDRERLEQKPAPRRGY
jgi:predicted RNase H-like HicB family nuclease